MFCPFLWFSTTHLRYYFIPQQPCCLSADQNRLRQWKNTSAPLFDQIPNATISCAQLLLSVLSDNNQRGPLETLRDD